MDLHVRFEFVFALKLCRAFIATQSSYRLCAQACDFAAWPPDKNSLDSRDRESWQVCPDAPFDWNLKLFR
jgi:hypothetical protein